MAYPGNGGKPVFHEVITPIGLLVHMSHDRPMGKTNETTRQPIIDPETGIQEAEYRVTIAWAKQRIAELQPMVALGQQVKGEAWPDSIRPGAFFALEPFFRDGDNPAHNTKKREYLFGCYYLNFRQKANAARGADGKVAYTGAPGLLGPYGEEIFPLDIWSGCTGRVSGIIFGSEYMGRNFLSVRLNNIQLYEPGERIGGGARPDPKTQFGALKDGALTGNGLPNLI